MAQLELHIVPREDRWHVSRNGMAIAIYDTREEALRQACDRAGVICGRQNARRWTMVLWGDDGKIQRRMSVPY